MCSHQQITGVEAVVDVEKVQPDIIQATDADPLADFWPVQTSDPQNAIIELAFDPDERPSALDAPVRVVASLFALVRVPLLDVKRTMRSTRHRRLAE